jgi:hypothetical protein
MNNAILEELNYPLVPRRWGNLPLWKELTSGRCIVTAQRVFSELQLRLVLPIKPEQHNRD